MLNSLSSKNRLTLCSWNSRCHSDCMNQVLNGLKKTKKKQNKKLEGTNFASCSTLLENTYSELQHLSVTFHTHFQMLSIIYHERYLLFFYQSDHTKTMFKFSESAFSVLCQQCWSQPTICQYKTYYRSLKHNINRGSLAFSCQNLQNQLKKRWTLKEDLGGGFVPNYCYIELVHFIFYFTCIVNFISDIFLFNKFI